MNDFYDRLYTSTIERWPAEDIVAFVERNHAELLGSSIIDLGCGSGRHSIYMARRALAVCGVDLSAVGIEYAREWAGGEKLQVDFQTADIGLLPYRSGCFGGLVSWEAIFYGEHSRVLQGITEAFRVLRPGGLFLISLKSAGDYRTREFPQQGPGTFETEQGLLMTFFTREEICGIFDPISDALNIELLARSLGNGARLRENYVVSGRKK